MKFNSVIKQFDNYGIHVLIYKIIHDIPYIYFSSSLCSISPPLLRPGSGTTPELHINAVF